MRRRIMVGTFLSLLAGVILADHFQLGLRPQILTVTFHDDGTCQMGGSALREALGDSLWQVGMAGSSGFELTNLVPDAAAVANCEIAPTPNGKPTSFVTAMVFLSPAKSAAGFPGEPAVYSAGRYTNRTGLPTLGTAVVTLVATETPCIVRHWNSYAGAMRILRVVPLPAAPARRGLAPSSVPVGDVSVRLRCQFG